MTLNKMGLNEYTKAELIGLDIEIVNAKNKSLIGLKGKIVDETKNTFIIEVDSKEKKLLKDQVTLIIHFEKEKVKVEGKLFLGRPEERIKK